jgi:hypothetical protein
MTEREALLALAAPEPEPFRQVWPSSEERAAWQAWNARRIEALRLARELERATA